MSLWDLVPLGIVKFIGHRWGERFPIRIGAGVIGPFYCTAWGGVLIRSRNQVDREQRALPDREEGERG